MSVTAIILAVCVVGGTGIFIGLFLGFAGKKFAVEVDEKEAAVLEALPGNNCGGCGYPGCSGLAAAIAAGEAPVGACPVGGEPVANVIGEIMGVSADAGEKKVAYVKCAGTCDAVKQQYDYSGVKDCTQMSFVQDNGPNACNYGCFGYGSCVDACPFDAIHIVDGVALVDREECKACSKCVDVCPQNLIELVPYKLKWEVQCSSKDKGKDVRSSCTEGCIGCKICEKECKFDAIHVVDNLAVLDPEKCKGCGACARKCPRHIIRMTKNGQPPEVKPKAAPKKAEAAPKKAEDAPEAKEAPKAEATKAPAEETKAEE